MKNERNKSHDQLFMELEKTMRRISFYTRLWAWFEMTGKLMFNVIGAILGSAWASLLIAFVFTGNLLYIRIFVGLLAVVIIVMFQEMWVESLMKYRKKKRWMESTKDMKGMEAPDANDPNRIFFPDEKPIKFKVVKKGDPAYGKEFFLYPMYGRLHPNRTISFFKLSELEISE